MMRALRQVGGVLGCLAIAGAGGAAVAADRGTVAAPTAEADEVTRITLPSGISLFVNPREGTWTSGPAAGGRSFSVDLVAPSAIAPVPQPGSPVLGLTRSGDDQPIAHNLIAGGYTDRALSAFAASDEVRGIGVQLNLGAFGAYLSAGAQHAEGLVGQDRAGGRSLASVLSDPFRTSLFNTDHATGGVAGSQTGAQVTVGYDVSMGALRFGPYGTVGVSRTQASGYVDRRAGGEAAALYPVDETPLHTLRAALGVSAGYVVNTSRGVVLPQLRLGWEHAVRDDTRPTALGEALGDGWTGGEGERSAFNLGFSVGTYMTNGIAGFVDVDVLLNNNTSAIDGSAVTFGVRKQF